METNMVFCFALLVLGITVVTASCPMGWAEFDGECLYFSNSKKSWRDAEASCRGKHAYLATDDNPKKHEFIRGHLNILTTWGAHNFWLGGSDYYVEGQWRWIETGVQMSGFAVWGPGFPHDSSLAKSCMNTYFNGTELFWGDYQCDQRHHHGFNYICEKKDDQGTEIIG